jgi:hypothetical protein
MSPEEAPRRDMESIIKRRELLYNAVLGSVAIAAILPVLSLAKSPVVELKGHEKRGYCVGAANPRKIF